MAEVVGRILSGDSNALQLTVNRNSEAAGDRLETGTGERGVNQLILYKHFC